MALVESTNFQMAQPSEAQLEKEFIESLIEHEESESEACEINSIASDDDDIIDALEEEHQKEENTKMDSELKELAQIIKEAVLESESDSEDELESDEESENESEILDSEGSDSE
jgi:uncharacterized protein YqfB (UPF0267 family)